MLPTLLRTLLSGSTTPAAPTSPSATASVAGITLKATPPAGTVTGYAVYRSTTPGGEGSTPIASGVSLPYLDATVASNTTYYYTLAAQNGALTGPQSSEVSALSYPGVPTGLALGAVTATTMTVTFTAPSGGAASYDVAYNTTNTTSGATVVNNFVSGSALTGLTSSTTYYVFVRAVNASGVSAWTASQNATTSFTPTSIANLAAYFAQTQGVTSQGGSTFRGALDHFYSAPAVAAIQIGGTQAFTICGFFQTTSAALQQGIVGQWYDASAYLVFINANKVNFILSDGTNTTQVTWATNITANTLYFFRAWFDGGTMFFDVNESGSPVSSAVAHLPETSSDPFTVGQWGGGAAFGHYMNGGIGPVAFAQQVLTTPDAAEIRNAGAGQTYANLSSGLKAKLTFYSTLSIAGENYAPTDDTGNVALTPYQIGNGGPWPGGGALASTADSAGIQSIADSSGLATATLAAGSCTQQPLLNQYTYANVGNWEIFGDAVHYGQTPVQYLTGGHVAALAFERTDAWTSQAIVRVTEIDASWILYAQRLASGNGTGWMVEYFASSGTLVFMFIDVSGNATYIQGSTVLRRHQPYVIQTRYDGSGGNCAAGMELWVNGVKESFTTPSSAVAGSVVDVTAKLGVLDYGAGTLPGAVAVSDLFFVSRKATDIEMVQWANYGLTKSGLNALPTTAPQVLVVGDSIAYGSGASSTNGQPYNQLQKLLPANWLVRNTALPGTTAAQWNSNYASWAAPFYSAGRSKNILWIHAGTNDLSGGASAATAYGSLTSLIQAAQATGWKVIVDTVITRAGSPGTTANWTATWAGLNALITGNGAAADAVVDLTAVLNDNTNRTQFNYDMVHPSDAGVVLMAAQGYPAVQALGGF